MIMSELEWIYHQRKDKFDLTLNTTAALDDGYTIDVPVIRGIGSDRRFDLYKECEEDTVFIFSVEFFFKEGQDRYSHGHPYDAEDALKHIDEFMAGTSMYDQHGRNIAVRKKKDPRKTSTLKNDILNGLGELAVCFVIMALAFVLAILLPTKSKDFEFYMLLAGMIFAVIVGVVLFIHLLCRELKKYKHMLKKEHDVDDQAELTYPAHRMKLRPSPFAAIQSGKKTIELRLNDEKRQKIKLGDSIIFTQTETGEIIRAVVSDIRKYPDFEAMYAVENPLAMGYNEGEMADPKDMSQYYMEDEIMRYGTLAIEIRRIDI